jgi:ferric-dicitrate binding protein FerR (iron transport regulator)
MQHQYLTVEDLLKDESFINYCRGEDARDVNRWTQYIADNPGQKELVAEGMRQYKMLFTVLATTDLEEEIAILRRKLDASEAAAVLPLKSYRSLLMGRWAYAAAIAVVVVLTSIYLLLDSKPVLPTTADMPQYASKRGERKIFQFPDGTQVTLNAGSEITLSRTFGQKTREVYLKGEAFFDVQHNKQLPFIVHTTNMDVRAVGTAFNVKSYDGDKRSETVLIRGLVEVTLKNDNNRKVLLHPDEKISLGENGKTTHRDMALQQLKNNKITEVPGLIKPVHKMEDGSVQELAWVQSNLVFDGESFENIALELERWYGVTIRFTAEEIKQYHFTATFKKEKIEQVLDIFKSSRSFTYELDGEGSVTISR